MELTSSSPTFPCALGWVAGPNRGPDVPLEKCLSGGAHSYVTGSSRSVSPSLSSVSTTSTLLFGSSASSTDNDSILSASISPPPSYQSIYPPSPPTSAPNSPLANGAVLIPVPAKLSGCFTNPIHKALSSPSSPIKPVLVTCSSSDSSSSDLISLASLSLSDSEDDSSSIFSSASSEQSDDNTSPSPLVDVFPISSPIHDLPSTSVDLACSTDDLVGAVVENPAMGTRTLYVAGGTYEHVNLRETVCSVLEKAEEELGCTGVVMCLEKKTRDLGELLHSLMYVGGTVVTGPFKHNDDFILVGLDV